MARIRTIKPELFFDEELAKLDARIRLFFIGLFCQADKGGKMEDRPDRIKATIFPYQRFDADLALNKLSPKFVTRYELNGKKYLKINSFLKHQRPHHTEIESIIPEPNGEIPVITPISAGRKGRERNMERNMERKGKEYPLPPSGELLLPPDLEINREEIITWLAYKREKGQSYKPRGLTALWRALRLIPSTHIKSSIQQSMANNWAGILDRKSVV